MGIITTNEEKFIVTIYNAMHLTLARVKSSCIYYVCPHSRNRPNESFFSIYIFQ